MNTIVSTDGCTLINVFRANLHIKVPVCGYNPEIILLFQQLFECYHYNSGFRYAHLFE